MTDLAMRKEMDEAISSGLDALESLREARTQLEKASRWGVLDLLGGGFVSGIMKHARIEQAEASLRLASDDLRTFARELDDVRLEINPDLEVRGVLLFADFFMDGFLADILVQEKIRRALRNIELATDRVDSIVDSLIRSRQNIFGC